MRVCRWVYGTTAEGPGRRFCLWVQGCPHRCPGCFNPETWSSQGGIEMDVPALLNLIRNGEEPIEGITLLGGEPFEQADELAQLCAQAHALGLGVLAFTGYTLDALHSRHDPGIDALLSQVDLLLDGPYIESLQDFSRPWVGSSNQRFHYLTDRYTPEQVAVCSNQLEIRLMPDGSIVFNGMPTPQILDQIRTQFAPGLHAPE